MNAIFFYCRSIVCLALFFRFYFICAQEQSVFQALPEETETYQLNVAFISSDTIQLDDIGSVYSFSVDLAIHQPEESSFTRLVLEDKDGNDYLVAESNWFRYDTTTVNLEHFCEETATLNGIIPVRLKCYINGNAIATLSNIHISSQLDTINSIKRLRLAENIRGEQVRDIVDRINNYNIKHGRLWRATITEASLLSFAEKNISADEYCDTYLNNMQYYSGGLYEIGIPSAYTDTIDSPYVPAFDWRNRHGKCWLTPVKWQGNSWYCTSFAAVGMLESNMLLHYNFNDTSIIDLSEQYVASYAGVSFESGGFTYRNLDFLMNDGTIEEDSMPFVNSKYYIPPTNRPTGNEHIKLMDYTKIDLLNISSIDTLKYYLIHRGPGICGYQTAKEPYTHIRKGGHAMVLAGYGTIVPDTLYNFINGNNLEMQFHIGDSIIGHTYWIYKNSWGASWGHNGYMYMIYYNNDPWYMNKEAFFPKGIPWSKEKRSFLCEDMDGDGFFNCGIETNAFDIPVWAQTDGDDSDPTIGQINEYGYCEQLPANHPTYEYIYNDSTLINFESSSNYIGVLRGATLTLQVQPSFENGTKILLDRGTTLIINGFTANLDFLHPYPGCKIILRNGAKIKKPFSTPIGVEFVIEDGTIE